MRALAIDPGLTTGWMLWHDGFEAAGQVEGTHAFLDLAECIVPGVDAVIIEQFEITERTLRTTREPWSLHIIGTVDWLAAKHEIPITLQTPADAKQFGTVTKMRRLGWPLHGPHARDAGRHMLLWLIRNGHMKGRELANRNTD